MQKLSTFCICLTSLVMPCFSQTPPAEKALPPVDPGVFALPEVSPDDPVKAPSVSTPKPQTKQELPKPQEPQEKKDEVKDSGWKSATPTPEILIDDKMPLETTAVAPQYSIFASSRIFDYTPYWWTTDKLRVRGSVYNGDIQTPPGIAISWKKSPFGLPGSVLKARFPVPPIPHVKEDIKVDTRYIVIEQGVLYYAQKKSLVSAGPFKVTLIKSNDEEEELLSLSEGKGVWSVTLPEQGVTITHWTSSALDCCRGPLSKVLTNEELRMLLSQAGEVLWHIIPYQPKTISTAQTEKKP